MVNKQKIRPALVNSALQKLTKISPFYSNITIDNEWEDLSEQPDPVLWRLLTDKNAEKSHKSDQTNSDDDIDGNDKFKERELKEASHLFQQSCIIIAPGEGQIPVSFNWEPNWEAIAFPKGYSTGRSHFNEEREIPITTKITKYGHVRLKHCVDRFAANPRYIFHVLDWIERKAVASSVRFAERKQFQCKSNVGQLVNHDNVRKMISDDQIFYSLEKRRGTPQFIHNMLLDVLAKTRQFGV